MFSTELSQISEDTSVFPANQPVGENKHDYLNGSYRFDDTGTKIVSWTRGYLEAEVIHGFDDQGQPIWVNGIINCNDPAHIDACDGRRPLH